LTTWVIVFWPVVTGIFVGLPKINYSQLTYLQVTIDNVGVFWDRLQCNSVLITRDSRMLRAS